MLTDPEAKGDNYASEPADGTFLIIRILEKEKLLENTSKDKATVSHCV